MSMDVVIIGDGPGGLSAALLLAKNGLDVVVYGEDKTAMHWAQIKNYLGVPEIHGSQFQKLARDQVASFGARIQNQHVESVSKASSGFTVTLAGGSSVGARYLILSEGKQPKLAQQLGVELDGTRAVTNRDGKTSVDGVYAVGRLARPGRSQAIISAGDGAAAALDILSAEKGKEFMDWDSPPKEPKG
jgi:thioredoxin reductase (NADPH)